VAAAVATLLGMPPAVAALPVTDRPDVTAEELVAAVEASEDVQHSGTAESRGRLDLPDVRRLGDLVALLGGTTRTRVWYAGPDAWRVDQQQATADVATYRDPAGTWTWDSTEGTAVRVRGAAGVRLPSPADLGPAELGRRLVAAAGEAAVTRTDARRIAGRTGLGLRLVPEDGRSLIDRVDLWVDEASGLPLRVAVTARQQSEPTTESGWLDLEVGWPPAEVLDFRLPPFVSPTVSDAPDVAALVDRFAPFQLPSALAGLPRTDGVGVGGRGGAGTYGEGFATLVVLPLPRDIARQTARSLDGAGLVREVELRGRQGLALDTPLLSALLVREAGRAYLLAGTVVPGVLEQAALELVLDPPPFRPEDSR
jgi:hypothetical protein